MSPSALPVRHVLVAAACALLLAACSTPSVRETRPAPSAPSGKSAYYKDDGPADVVPDLDAVPEAVPRREPLNRFANRPYTVFGREYVPATTLRPYRERGVASWYGRKFHGQKTSTGETYDMFAMTAAHPTLPLPSFARVTNPANGRSVIVRVNDRGPFLNDRVIDLSYAAAHRLGIAQKGSGEVEVEALLLDDPIALATAPLPPVASGATLVRAASAPASGAPSVETTFTGATSTIAAPVALPATAAAASPVALTATAAAASPPVAPAESVPVAGTGSGYAVQLGAFASYPNAQAFAARLANQLPALGVEAQIRQVNGLFRVFVGPYAARDDARRTADRIGSALGLPTVVALH